MALEIVFQELGGAAGNLSGSAPSGTPGPGQFVTGAYNSLVRAGGKFTNENPATTFNASKQAYNLASDCLRAVAVISGYGGGNIGLSVLAAGSNSGLGGSQSGYMALLESNGISLWEITAAGHQFTNQKTYGTPTFPCTLAIEFDPATGAIVASATGIGTVSWTDPTPYSAGTWSVLDAPPGTLAQFTSWTGYRNYVAPVAPNPPTDLAFTTTATSFTATVTPSGSGPAATSFELQYRLQGDVAWTAVAAQGSAIFNVAVPTLGAKVYEVQARSIAGGLSSTWYGETVATDNPGSGTWTLGLGADLASNAAASSLAAGSLSSGASLAGNAAAHAAAAAAIGTSNPVVLAGDANAAPVASANLTVPPSYDKVTDYLGQALYATIADLVRRYGEPEIVQLSDKAGLNLIGFEVCLRSLSDASIEMDSYLGVRYPLPIAPVPAIANLICSEIARYRLYEDAATQEVRQRYVDAVARLKDIAAGKITLGIAEASAGGATAPTNAGMPSIAAPAAGMFGTESGF